MKNINVENNLDLVLFNQILGDNISMLFGDLDSTINGLFAEKVSDKIDNLDICSWNYKDDVINEKVHGNTTFSDDGRTSIKMYGMTGYKDDLKYIEMIFSHELWHALMVVFNNVYGKYFKRSIELDSDIYDISSYSGFLKCTSGEYSFTPGYYMADSLAQTLALSVVKKRNDSSFVIDDAFKYKLDEKLLNSPTDDLLTFFQMFVAAFSLSSKNWMDKNYTSNKGLLESDTANEKSNILPNNIYISESIRNPISIMDEYDKYKGKGSYIELQTRIDASYRRYLNEGIMDSKEFIGIAKELRDFIVRRLYDLVDKSLISSTEYSELLGDFNKLYDAFLKEIKVYKVLCAKVKFKKIVKNLVKKRIK